LWRSGWKEKEPVEGKGKPPENLDGTAGKKWMEEGGSGKPWGLGLDAALRENTDGKGTCGVQYN